jgi:hypothetical protein
LSLITKIYILQYNNVIQEHVMTVEELRGKLEAIVSNLTSSGTDTIDPGVIETLDRYAVTAGELGMNSGKKLIENLSEALKTHKNGESTAVRVTALDFYLKNIQGGGAEEEL